MPARLRMSRFHHYYTHGVFGLLTLTAGALGGLHLSRWLAEGNTPAAPLDAHFPPTPDPSVTATWIDLFDAAHGEIWLAAGRLESERVLQALDAAARRGVAVHLTLSPAQNPSADAGTRGWLRYRTSLRDVRLSRHAFEGAACVVDGARAVVTAQSLLPERANASDGGIFFYAANREIGGKLRARLKDQHTDSSAEIASP
jgi:hypothetical protein